ncbi:hypothetical protein GCM10029978_052190 [Actinoallomurus acanthiterrae]
MDFDAYERRLWAGRAADYDRAFARMTAHSTGALLDTAEVAQGTRLLDVGTGSGVMAEAAAARGARVTAVDATGDGQVALPVAALLAAGTR